MTAAPRWAVAGLWAATFAAVDPGGFVATGPLRTAAVSAAAMLTVAAALLARSRAGPPCRFAPWPSAVWAALVGMLSLAAVAGIDPLHRWIGTPDRRLGLVTWLGFGLLFLAGQQLGDPADRRAASLAATGAVAFAGTWALAEVAGHPPLGLTFAAGRAGGPFGQPAYLGAALVLGLPLAVAVAAAGTAPAGSRRDGSSRLDGRNRWNRRAPWGRWLAAAAVALGTAGAVASQTRAAAIGLAAAGALTVARRPWPARRRRAAAAAGLAALVVVVGAGAASSHRIRASFGQQGIGSRLDEWELAAAVIARHPVLGLGPEGYRIGFTEQVDAGYVRAYGLAAQPDRAHNAILDVAATGGVPAGAAYACLLALVAAACWRAAAGADPLLGGLAAGVLGYGAQQLFLFPLSELDPLFWLSAGMVVGAGAGGRAAGGARWATVAGTVAGVAAAAAVPLLVWFGALEVAGDRALAAGTLQGADRATELRPDSIRHWFAASRLAGQGETILDVDAALDRIEQGLLRSPRDPILRREHSSLLTERALRGQLETDLGTAAGTTAGYLTSAPNDPVLWRNRALLAEAAGDLAVARDATSAALDLDPSDPLTAALAARLR